MSRRFTWLLVAIPAAIGAALGFMALSTARAAGDDEEATRLLSEGKRAMADREYARAADHFQALAAKFPKNVLADEALAHQARAHLLAGAPDKAMKAAAALLDGYPKSSWRDKAEYLIADAYSRSNQPRLAAVRYREKLDALLSPQARELLAKKYLEIADAGFNGEVPETLGPYEKPEPRKDFARAADFYARATAIGLPADRGEEVPDRIARCWYELAQYPSAAAAWEEFLKARPKARERARVLYSLGQCYERMRRDGEARERLETFLAENKKHELLPDAVYLLGVIERPGERGDEKSVRAALRHWERFAGEFKSHALAEQALLGSGAVWSGMGRHMEAIEAWQRFLNIFPDGKLAPEAMAGIARSRHAREEFDEARTTWTTLLARFPSSSAWQEAQTGAADAAFEKGRRARGKKEYEAARKAWDDFQRDYPLDPRGPTILIEYGEMERERGAHVKAIDQWRAVAARYPGTVQGAEAQIRIARAYQNEVGDLARALTEYEALMRYGGTRQAQEAAQAVATMRQTHFRLSVERAFHTGEEAKLRLETRNVESVKFKLYRLDLQTCFRQNRGRFRIEEVVTEIIEPDKSWEEKVPGYMPYRLHVSEFKLPVAGEGAWIVEAAERRMRAKALALVSDVSMVVKRSPSQVLVFARDEKADAPAEGVAVHAFRPNGPEKVGETDAEGVFLANTVDFDANNLFAVRGGHVAFASVGAPGGAWGYEPKGYIYTDRPVYRPGQQVFYRAVIRTVRDGEYAVPAGAAAVVEARNPRGAVVHRETRELSRFGSLSGQFALSEEPPLGQWALTVTTTADSRSFGGSFEVQEYKKPEFVITVTTEKAAYLAGEEVKATAEVSYYFGGPVRDTEVRYAVYKGLFAFDRDRFNEFGWFLADQKPPRPDPSFEPHAPPATGRTDDKGRVEIKFTTDRAQVDRQYLIEVSAADLNRRTVSGAASVPVTQQEFFAVVKPDRRVYQPKEEARVNVRTVGPDYAGGAREGHLLMLRLKRSVIDRERGVFVAGPESADEIARVAVTTDAKGEGSAALRFPEPGRYRLTYLSKDRAGVAVMDSAEVEAAGEAEDLEKQAKIIAEKEFYLEGETARVFVNTPVANSWMLLTYEAERILGYQVKRLPTRANQIDIPVKAGFAPSVTLAVAIPVNWRLYESRDELKVLKFLNVAVKADKPAYKPREKAALSLKVTDQQGEPAEAEVSLSVIDASVLAVRADTLKEMRAFFYDRKRNHLVSGASSLAFRYDAQTLEIPRELLEEQERRVWTESGEALKSLEAVRESLDAGVTWSVQEEAPSAQPAATPAPAIRAPAKPAAPENMLRRARDRRKEEAEKKGDAKDKAAYGDEFDDAEAYDPELKRGIDALEGAADGPAAADGVAGGRSFGALRGRGGGAAGKLAKNGATRAPIYADPAFTRSRFADTAFWKADVVTDDQGEARLEFELPDNLTSWRAVARGASMETLVGEGRGDFRARKEVLVRVDTPRFLVEGDRSTAASVAHNYTAKESAFKFEFAVKNLRAKDLTPLEFTLKPGAARLVDREIEALKPGVATVTSTARSESEADAADSPLPVLARGAPWQTGASGVVGAGQRVTFDTPKDLIEETWRGSLSLSSTVDADLVRPLMSLDEFPYGCVEQTVNRFLPALAVLEALKRLNIADPALEERTRAAVTRGVALVSDLQQSDGGWGWFPGDASRGGYTAYALLSLGRARRFGGYAAPPEVIERGVAFARRALSSAPDDERAFLLWALGANGVDDAAQRARLARMPESLSPFGLACLILVTQERGGRPGDLVARLRTLAKKDDTFVSWPGAGGPRAFTGGDVEATGLALAALVAGGGAGAAGDEDATRAAAFLTSRRAGAAWPTTKATGFALLGLTSFLANARADVARGEGQVTFNGLPLGTFKLAGGKDLGQPVEIAIPFEKLRPAAKNEMSISFNGAGAVGFVLRATAVVREKEPQPRGTVLKVSRTAQSFLPPLLKEAELRRLHAGWSIVEPEARPKPKPPETLTSAAPGEYQQVTLLLTASEAVEHVVMEDPLPAGCEVVSEDSIGLRAFGAITEEAARAIPGTVEAGRGVMHVEVRDEKAAFFLSQVGAGVTALRYVRQAITPGAYTVLPATASCMYEPGLFARTGEAEFTVSTSAAARGAVAKEVTPDELYAQANELFAAGTWEKAGRIYRRLRAEYRLLEQPAEECLARLITVYHRLRQFKEAVGAYEELIDRNSRAAVLAPATMRDLSEAYFEVGRFEDAVNVALGETWRDFYRRADLGRIYRDLRQAEKAQAWNLGLLRSSPDGNLNASFWFQTAARYREMPVSKTAAKYQYFDTGEVRTRYVDSFLSLMDLVAWHADWTEAATANHAAITDLFALQADERCAVESARFIRRFPDHHLLDDVLVVLMRSQYRAGNHKRALAVAEKLFSDQFRVGDGSDRSRNFSPHRAEALLTRARVHHAAGDVAPAVESYETYVRMFGSPQEVTDVLRFLKGVRLDPDRIVETPLDGEPQLRIRHKNLTEIEFEVYRVDLMLLFLQRRDLRNVAEVDLTGISPRRKWKSDLADQPKYREVESAYPLGLDEPGVYLIYTRAGQSRASSVLIWSDLDLRVDRDSNRVNVFVTSKKTGKPVADVFVRVAVGGAMAASGVTDARGVFSTSVGGGALTLVAQKEKQYALYQGN
ncbi:MAG: tetratricopeptide repeat protein [Planctomycetes bacterium]|nr:tetratricopeptide repeat protein [Planctomycetota bacterium]